MFKPVVAVEGDFVEVSDAGVWVNGSLLDNSSVPADILERDTKHGARPLPRYPAGSYVVPAGMLWVVSSYNQRSYDSRYFGPVPVAYVRGTLSLLWEF